MPLKYKIPGYAGNALLLALCIVMIFSGSFAIGGLLGALAALNLFLIHKLDQFSRVWSAHEAEIADVRNELQAARGRIAGLEAASGKAPVVPQPPP